MLKIMIHINMPRLKLCKSWFAYFPSDFGIGENIKNRHVLLCPAPSKRNGTSSHLNGTTKKVEEVQELPIQQKLGFLGFADTVMV